MFSCLGRLGCLVLILLAGVIAWLSRERWMPRVLGDGNRPAVTWEPLTDAGAGKAGDAVQSLARSGGPAYVTLTAAELGALMVASTGHRLPAALDSVQAAIEGETIRVRALVQLDDIRGLDALGPLSGLLDKKERIEFTGSLSVVRPGLGEFRVSSVQVADLSLPRAAIPRLLQRLDAGTRPDGLAPEGIPISIPAHIGDVRVARGVVTVYRRTP